MNAQLLPHLDAVATAPGGVARLRELILTLAVQGKLVAQDPADEPASRLLQKIRAEKDRLIAEGKIKRDKPLAEIAEEDKPFELPVGWEWVRLGALLKKVGAGSTPLGGREVYVSSGVKFLRSQNVWNDGLRLDGVAFIRPETHAKMAGTVVVANDLLFNITGASIGRCAVVPGDFDEANVSQHVTIIRTVLTELNAFLHKVLVSRHVQQTVMDVQVGVSREGLSIAKLGQFLVPLPPLAEQSRIVTRVEALMRLCDALEAKGQLEATQHAQLVSTLLGTLTASTTAEELADNWQRVAQHFDLLLDRPEAIDTLEQTLLQLAVRGLLVPQNPADEPASALLQKIRAEKDRLIATGQIKRDKALAPITDEEKPFGLPVGWEWASLATIGVINPRNDAPNETLASFVQMSSIPVEFSAPHVSEPRPWKDIKSGFTQFAEGDVGVAKITPCFENGKSTVFQNLSNGIGAGTTELHIVRPLGGIERRYVLLFLKTPAFLKDGEAVMTGSAGQKRLPRSYFESKPFPLPPLAEQSRIVARVEALMRLCADLRQRLAQQQSVQARLAQALVESVG